LGSAGSIEAATLGGTSSKKRTIRFAAVVGVVNTDDICTFIESYHWLESDFKYPERPAETTLQLEFLRDQPHGIKSWIIIAPQRQKSFGAELPVSPSINLTVKERHREEVGRGFQVFGEPLHRLVANYFAQMDPGDAKEFLSVPDSKTSSRFSAGQGVMLLYPVRETEDGTVSVGFELFFPNNDLPFDMNFTVHRNTPDVTIPA
jgi:hypothetical protein